MTPAKRLTAILVFCLPSVGFSTAHAGWGDFLDRILQPDESRSPAVAPSPAAFSQADLTTALKQALDNGVRYAIQGLGRKDGFLANPRVRIPTPDSLAWAEKGLRTLGQDQLVEDFELSLNRAAEEAVPEVLDILLKAVKTMSVTDAESILRSSQDDAATAYFRRTSETALTERIRPIVARATSQANVTGYYKAMVQKAGFMAQFAPQEALDLDGYVTQRALDGLFLTIAQEEKRIREDPVARTTDLMRGVFDAYVKRP